MIEHVFKGHDRKMRGIPFMFDPKGRRINGRVLILRGEFKGLFRWSGCPQSGEAVPP